MDCISVPGGSNVTGHARLCVVVTVWAAWIGAFVAGAGPALASAAQGPPPADVSIALRDGRFLHLEPLPFGTLAAVPVGMARFDESGTRALLVAQFTGAGIHGDWRSANPTFAYLLDAQRRSLTQLSSDGRARSAIWNGATSVSIHEESRDPYDLSVAGSSAGALPPARIDASDSIPDGSTPVSPKSTDRLAVYKAASGRYVVLQIGAARFRTLGIAGNGAYAIIGGYLAWIDGQRHVANHVRRFGPDLVLPLTFSGSPYGDALVTIRPLGIPVYQTAYRNGVAYFTFSYGVQRIVAASADLSTFWFPKLPHDPVFTVGDGFGMSPDGAPYFVRPEEDVMLFTRAHRYVRAQMTGLDAARDPAALDRSLPSIDPSENALQTALLQWRFYPAGDTSGQRWVASHLGRLLIGDSAGRFAPHVPPAFPFAVLGRTDDGRLWGASPIVSRSAPSSSALYSSRDGISWQRIAILRGGAGAVGSHAGAIWIALTSPWHGRPMIWLCRLGDASAAELFAATGGTFAGEQLGFADLSNGFYLVWGATPGWRLNGQGGPLSGFRVDEAVLRGADSSGDDTYTLQRLSPQSDPSMPAPASPPSGIDA
ncbi:MAG: hypothetical protein JO347_02140, partial [Candidatus Eremiobacteraeota bacterium]|nr:hypothetical protein [Candidatus Eremiobacteraeota bacterium]